MCTRTHGGVTQEAMSLRNALEEKQLEIEHLTLELRRTKEKSMLKNTENMNRLRDKYTISFWIDFCITTNLLVISVEL